MRHTSLSPWLWKAGPQFVASWLISGGIIWWLFPRLFWVSFQGLALLQALLIGYLMAWSMQIKRVSVSEKYALLLGTVAAPLGFLLNQALLNLSSMNSDTLLPSARSLSGNGLVAVVTLVVVGALATLLLGLIGSTIGIGLTRFPQLKGQAGAPVRLLLKIVPGIMVPLLLILVAHGWANKNNFDPAASNYLSEQDAGRVIEVGANTEFDIVLDGYPTRGYSWEWIEADWEIVGGGAWNYRQNWGGGGQTWFHAWATSPGQSPIRIVYHRDSTEPPMKTFEVEILVK